jgi:hypothetical protein
MKERGARAQPKALGAEPVLCEAEGGHPCRRKRETQGGFHIQGGDFPATYGAHAPACSTNRENIVFGDKITQNLVEVDNYYYKLFYSFKGVI